MKATRDHHLWGSWFFETTVDGLVARVVKKYAVKGIEPKLFVAEQTWAFGVTQFDDPDTHSLIAAAALGGIWQPVVDRLLERYDDPELHRHLGHILMLAGLEPDC